MGGWTPRRGGMGGESVRGWAAHGEMGGGSAVGLAGEASMGVIPQSDPW